MTGRDSDKGHRYIIALENARCQDKWDEVPELIRKVTKHAPQKTCLLEVASAEYQIASHIHKEASTPRSTSASSSLHELVPPLLSTVNRAEGPKQEVFQAQVCLGWVHWTLNEPTLATSRFPANFGETIHDLESAGEELSPWTQACLVKACYLKAASQRMMSDAGDALDTLESLIPWLSSHLQGSALSNPQFLYWSERLVAEGASITVEDALRDIGATDAQTVTTALGFLRLWASHPNIKQATASQSVPADNATGSALRSSLWKSYYDLLTAILRHGVPYSPSTNGPERPQLASEIRRVEAVCEANLLRETKFPAADSSNPHVEDWVEEVMSNWQVLCGPTWTDEELGEGGQNAVGRNVLDILYRAATKTYHSHLILRRLFHVHCALGDSALAIKALDSYIEIVTSAKHRAEKGAESGELENDGTLLRTIAEGVTVLCCFGSEKEAEKARDLTQLLKDFAAKHVQENKDQDQRVVVITPETNSTASQVVSPLDIAAAYRGIGIGLANWAYWTPINEDRDDIRAEAIDYLDKSLAPELEDGSNRSSLYTLALLLAEDRDIDGAIEYVRSALTSDTQPRSGQADFTRERELVPLWHLLALLLSAKEDFDIAERSCEAAFEQFPATITSLAHSDRQPPKHHHNPQEQAVTGLTQALIDQLRNREKERIIETRMTQLAFVELLEGPENALNHSEQLLSLFATLFRSLNLETDEKPSSAPADHLVPPKSSAGTVKSLRGSIFGRHRGPRAKTESAPDSRAEGHAPSHTGAAPALQITGDAPADSQAPAGHGLRKLRTRGNTLQKTDGVQEQISTQSIGNTAAQAGPDTVPQPPSATVVGMAVADAATQPSTARQSLESIPHNQKHDEQPPPTGHPHQPPVQDTRLPLSYAFDSPTRAVTKVPPIQSQKHALSILVNIWLLIAGLYRRASSFEDAHEACEEASKQIVRFESLVASQESSARAFRERGWACPKSCQDLWADLYAERGLLSNAQARPHEAIEHFEKALRHEMDHPKATIGLSSLLLDIWDRKIPLEPPTRGIELDPSMFPLSYPLSEHRQKSGQADSALPNEDGAEKEEEPRLLNRIAARERAFGLLSALTKRGSSWDNSEAWYALSRAYEAVGQIEKLKEVLWWCIELEDRRPIRPWSSIGSGIYVL
ncbi:putative filamentation protein (Rhf1) [Aspergillus homomorphus CBS 101889]|uniref:Uncharacterized protein n=1 Tax=Aspergillus homomorphus (strain CBS 101889) TaxID=1450537 RepID=A0A395HQD0_ASPHC|nr:hypothetical protein BO97DRAFT_145585 [Aspergillus homomorphus CBS 101889]RAL10027.1 hypothetical protein BO97DRAFT_145585 [Aspergillus homomorphus CBS 101889]